MRPVREEESERETKETGSTHASITFAPEESTRRGDLETVGTDIGRSKGVTVRHPLIAAQVWGSLSPDYMPRDYYK